MTRWSEVTEAVGVALGGATERGAALLTSCWEGTAGGDHGQRCVISHYLADLQGDLADEVAWDERAWAEYLHVAEADLAPVGIPSASGLAPSLHLNLGDGYLRQGRVADARAQLAAGLAAADALADDPYGAMIRGGLRALGDRLEAVTSGGPATG